jgi:hypothetical protein
MGRHAAECRDGIRLVLRDLGGQQRRAIHPAECHQVT